MNVARYVICTLEDTQKNGEDWKIYNFPIY
jgi:hypothetical protein